jgi:hypothetical protein
MNKTRKLMTAALIATSAAMAPLSANAFWGWGPWDGWGGPWGGSPYYGGYPGYGYGYPAYGNRGYGYPGYGYGYAPYYGVPYVPAAPQTAAPAKKEAVK